MHYLHTNCLFVRVFAVETIRKQHITAEQTNRSLFTVLWTRDMHSNTEMNTLLLLLLLLLLFSYTLIIRVPFELPMSVASHCYQQFYFHISRD